MSIFQLSDTFVLYLNSLDSVDEFPSYLIIPTLSEKVSKIERVETGGFSAVANEFINKGEVLCFCDGSFINRPIKYSWQIGDNLHMIGPGIFDHKCETFNCIIDKDYNIIARRDIRTGELLTFNYLTSEYELSESFACVCGDDNCFGLIKGFKYLKSNQKQFLLDIGVTLYVKDRGTL